MTMVMCWSGLWSRISSAILMSTPCRDHNSRSIPGGWGSTRAAAILSLRDQRTFSTQTSLDSGRPCTSTITVRRFIGSGVT
jgi:hypothetical protein